MKRASVSTHVLDVSVGKPVAGVSVTIDGHKPQMTDANGRIAELLTGGIEGGAHQLVFDVGPYFGERPHLLNKVTLDLWIDDGQHYHVPLLISPFGFTTYRGT
jgi:5-hydroxyisourate hydrolase